MLEAVIFDLDNTLIDWRGSGENYLQTGLRALAPVHDYLETHGFILPSLEDFALVFQQARDQVWDDARGNGWFAPNLEHHFRKTFYLLGFEEDHVDFAILASLFDWQAVEGVELYPDAKQVLGKLRASGVNLGLLTNASYPMRLRDRELEALGIKDCFSVRIASSDVGEAKPNPLPFERILGEMGVDREKTVFVGDSLEQDIAGARNTGLRSIWVVRQRTMPSDGILSPMPDAAVFSLNAVLEVLDHWYPDWSDSKDG